MDAETHERSGHTSVVVNDEHAAMNALLGEEEFYWEVAIGVLRGRDGLNNHVARPTDS